MDQRRAEDKLKLTAETQNLNPQHHLPPPPQKCPRCESSNTKFCYYNNYSLSQPRYFCKACRRYWTQGGSLRNVPVGGGCRKSKRPKPSVSSSSNSANEIARTTATQSLSTALPSQSLAGVISGQGLRANLPPVMPPSIGNSFYTGGTFLSSLAAMQSLPGGINQGRTLNLGGGNSQYESNMTLLHGVSLPSLRTQAAPQHFQNHEFFQSQAIPARPLDSWTQSFTNRATTASSTANPTFWSGANTTSRDNQAGSSFTTPNQWQDKYPGFDPPQ